MRGKGPRAGNANRRSGRPQLWGVFSSSLSSDKFFCDTIKCCYCKSPSDMGFLTFAAQASCLEIALQNVSLSRRHFTQTYSVLSHEAELLCFSPLVL